MRSRCLLLLASFAFSTAASAVPIPVEARLSALASLRQGISFEEDADSAVRFGLPDPMAAGAFAVLGTDSRSLIDARAEWLGAGSGSLLFEAEQQVSENGDAYSAGSLIYLFTAGVSDTRVRIAFTRTNGTMSMSVDGQTLQLLDPSGVVELDLLPGFATHVMILNYTSPILVAGQLESSASFAWNVVPEPGTGLLLAGGLVSLAARSRRRN